MRSVLAFAAAAILVASVAGWFQKTDWRRQHETSNATAVSRAIFCPKPAKDCSPQDYSKVELPHFPKVPIHHGRRAASYRLSVQAKDILGTVPSVFVPDFSDNLRMFFNGSQISPDRFDQPELHHHWHRPYFTHFSRDLLRPGLNVLQIDLVALPSGRIYLSEVLIGPARHLDLEAHRHHVARLGQVRTYGAVAMFMVLPVFFTWLSRRRDMVLFWIVFSLANGSIVALHQSLPNFHLRYPHWPVIWNLALMMYCVGIWFYARSIFAMSFGRAQWGALCLVATAGMALYLADADQYFGVAAVAHCLSAIFGIGAISVFLRNWTASDWPKRLHIPFLVVAAGAGLNDYIFFVLHPDWIVSSRGGLAMIVIVVGVFAVLFHRLASTLRGYENLNRTMRQTIEDRTAELVATQAKVTAIERQRAIHEERERIMFDLHDGVGGQLVNIRSYIEIQTDTDATLIGSLDEAMRDLALIIDSLEGAENLGSLFVSLKERLEPMLRANGIGFVWDLETLPPVPFADPSKHLNIIRIAQEAITNAVKHAKAQEISVTSCRRGIAIRDDGQGYDDTIAAKKRGVNSGLGLRGMQKRATEIGASLDLQTGHHGTLVRLHWFNE